jgi:hypothetical protein
VIKLKDILNESYQFKQGDVDYDEMDNSLLNVTYTFNTPHNKYRVELYGGDYPAQAKTFSLNFGIDKGYGYSLDTKQMTGQGDVREIIKTLADIINEFIQKFPQQVNRVLIEGTDDKRKRVYKALFPKYLDPSIRSKVHIS